MRSGKNLNFPKIIEEEDKTVIVYSNEYINKCEDEEGIKIYYSDQGDVVKIIIPRDENYCLINL